MKSQYIQRKRTKGFNLQAASPDGRSVVSCTRGKHWGGEWANPYRIVKEDGTYYVVGFMMGSLSYISVHGTKEQAAMNAVTLFREYAVPSADLICRYLNGKHLSCWCAPGSPCHVQDVLLPILNEEEPRTY